MIFSQLHSPACIDEGPVIPVCQIRLLPHSSSSGRNMQIRVELWIILWNHRSCKTSDGGRYFKAMVGFGDEGDASGFRNNM